LARSDNPELAIISNGTLKGFASPQTISG
jgi:hypothetical protein